MENEKKTIILAKTRKRGLLCAYPPIREAVDNFLDECLSWHLAFNSRATEQPKALAIRKSVGLWLVHQILTVNRRGVAAM